MKNFLMKMAWPMTPPVPYSLFHILFICIGVSAVIILSYYTARRIKSPQLPRLFFFCGILLAATECWKQLFLYYIVNLQTFNWWYFPFQLCSIPMYICIILPLLPLRIKNTVLYTFMQDFSLLGGVMALAEPSGLFHPYWLLTIHGLIWHLLLIYMGLVISFTHVSDTSLMGFVRILPLFSACCIIASIINRTAQPLGQADMFYISPYYPSNQIVFHEIALRFGILAGNGIYLFATCLGGFLIHIIFRNFKFSSLPS